MASKQSKYAKETPTSATIQPSTTHNDPLLPGYWHLKGTAGATKGANVVDVWDEFRGTGVVLGIIDDGVEHTHPDLVSNYGFDLDYDGRNDDFDAYPSDPADRHGTAVAGVAGAALDNATGGAGVAPLATLVGYRIAFNASAEANLALVYQHVADLDVANNSWGYDGFLSDSYDAPAFAPIFAGLHDAVETGRDGLGTVIVFAAGNYRTSGQDVNYHNFQNDRGVITVAATDSAGNIASFSTPGDAILVAAPGVSIATTDRFGGNGGFSPGGYTTLSGTSFSSPLVSGVAALMLDANPGLGWRDVQEILASTAVQTGSAASWSFNHAYGWNGGAMHVSSDFGFGLVDAMAAVRVAESWRAVSTSANEAVVFNSVMPGQAITDLGSVQSSLVLADGVRIDRVEVDLTISHLNIADLRVVLTSPTGTQSVLFNNAPTGQDNIAFTFSTTHDWGEMSGGEWILTVSDTRAGVTGTLEGWALRAYGDLAANDTYVYTDEFGALAATDSSRLVIADWQGVDSINTAAIAAATSLDLRAGHSSTIDGQTVTIAESTVIENADTGDGNDTIIGNDVANWLRGWRGDDTLDGGLGADTLEGGTGNDSYVVDDSGDTVIEAVGAGIDTVASAIDFTLHAALENLTLIGAGAIDGTGNEFDNVLIGNAAVNSLTGLGGNDTLDGAGGGDLLDGGLGDDTYFIDDAADSVIEAGGIDTINSSISYTLGAGLENLTLIGAGAIDGAGNALDNILIGNGANNTLTGGAGADILDGGAGTDALQGGLGDDTYVVDALDVLTENAGEGIDTVVSSIDYMLGNEIENLVLAGSAAMGTGNALANHVTGNTADNALFGLNGDDILEGGGGNDTLDGGAGVDQLIGGAGNDTFLVDNAGDQVVETAGGGTDAVRTTLSSYALGADLENLFFDGSGDFAGTGNTLANRIVGAAGNDTLDGGAGADTLEGGTGNDTYVVDAALDVVIESAGAGIDTVRSSLTYTLGADVENLTLVGAAAISGTGNALDNVITGNSANNTLTGGDGSDTLDGGAGVDTLNGGLGDDFYVIDATADLIVDSGGTDTALTTRAVYVLHASLENLTFTGAGSFSGTGTAGNNVITGGTGNDTLNGGAGVDTLQGGLGDDTYIVDIASDVVVEAAGGGTDTVSSAVTFTLAANVENLVLTGALAINGTGNSLANALTGNAAANTLDGGAGADTMTGAAGNDTYIVDDAGDTVVEAAAGGTDLVKSALTYTLGAQVENLTLTGAAAINGTGNALANSIVGNAASNQLFGLDGNDTLNGGAGADTMTGGTGNDSYVVDDAGDAVIELAAGGTDTVSSSIAYTLGAEVENLTLTGAAAINGSGNALSNVITGNGAANQLFGFDGNDTLNGGAGADTMTGGAGNDAYTVDNAGDAVIELAGGGTDTVSTSITYTLGADVENLTLTGAAAIDGSGNALANVILGNAAANHLFGFEGNDSLNGGAGADTMTGGAGNDSYTVDNAGDVVNEDAGGGIDTVVSAITYTLGDELENLTLGGATAINGSGNALANTIVGNAAANQLFGFEGNDTLNGGAGADTMTGGGGNDSYTVDNAGDVVNEDAGGGIDTVSSTITYTLGAEVENLTLTGAAATNGTGNALANSILGNAAANQLFGLDGDDMLNGGAGADRLTGGGGNDTYTVDNAGDLVIEAAGQGTDTVLSSITYTLAAETENLTLTGIGAINGTGNLLANVIVGNGAANHLFGLDGDDTLNGGAGADTMRGGIGNDSYTVDNALDAVIENAGEGTDAVSSSVTYTLTAHVEALTLTGVAAINGTGNTLDNSLTGNAAANTLDGGAGADVMAGGLGNDTYLVDNASDAVTENAAGGTDTVRTGLASYVLPAEVENLTYTGSAAFAGTGNALNNTITGGAGNDILDGGAGNDTLYGGLGNDTFLVDSTGDIVSDTGGTETVQTTLSSYTLGTGIENLVYAGTGNFNGTGNTVANALSGGAGDDTLNGGTGGDTLTGGLGNDSYVVDNALDTVVENPGAGTDTVSASVSYTLPGEVENLNLTGLSSLNGTGNALDNTLTGNSGANTLDGGLGADVLFGGAGNDIFAFMLGAAAGDVVLDFTGNGAAAGDSLRFVGFGAGATFAAVGATDYWSIQYGSMSETIQLVGVTSLAPTDYVFV